MSDLVRDHRLNPRAIETLAAGGDPIRFDGDETERAAAAIAAGLRGDAGAVPALLEQADADDLAARAAGWALGRLDCEAALREAAAEGGLDLREQAYRGLAGIAARDAASDELAEVMRQRIDAELERAASGRTSLAEHATRVLAVLGCDDTAGLIARVIREDGLADRYELERQRKQVESDGRELTGDWNEVFADHLVGADDEDEAPDTTSPIVGGDDATGGSPSQAPPMPQPDQAATLQSDGAAPPEAGAADETTAGEAGGADQDDGLSEDERNAQPVDWEAFATSPECSGLEDDLRNLATQVGPMLEQITAQVAQLPLTAITGQELAGVLLQVLPQAAPQQVTQAVLSPQGLTAIQAVARFLARTGAAVHGEDLVQGVKLVRETMRDQIRQSGMLGGPDYSDPDEGATDAEPED